MGISRSIYIVDDDSTLVDALSELLTDEGYRAEGFIDAREALVRLHQGSRPDLLLLDYMMPLMTGAEFIAELDRERIDLDVVLFTGMQPSAIEPHSRVRTILRKPFDLDQLLSSIARLARAA